MDQGEVGRVRDLAPEPSGQGATLRVLAFVVVLLIALGFLMLINWLLRGGGLWGDLVFALVIMTLAFWILGRLQLSSSCSGTNRTSRRSTRALAATMFVLVGVPITLVNWLAGLIILFVPLLVATGPRLHESYLGWPKTRRPPLWKVTLGAIGLLILFLLFQKPLTPEDLVPEAIPVPRAAAEGSDAQLAAAFRPLLFFDSGERRYPLDIDDAIADEPDRPCAASTSSPTTARTSRTPSRSTRASTTWTSTTPARRRGAEGTRAPTTTTSSAARTASSSTTGGSTRGTRRRSPTRSSAGPGFRTPPFTCQEHAGDWEGITVVLAPCEEASDSCVDVGRRALGPDRRALRAARAPALVLVGADARARRGRPSRARAPRRSPRSGTASSFPRSRTTACGPSSSSRATATPPTPTRASAAAAARRSAVLPEARYDGGLPWSHNDDGCDGCLRPLPIGEDGEPALWNAFPGHWGSQECILAGAYCDLSQAPRGPVLPGPLQGSRERRQVDLRRGSGTDRSGSAPCGAAEARE